jgi:hypothetical protein
MIHSSPAHSEKKNMIQKIIRGITNNKVATSGFSFILLRISTSWALKRRVFTNILICKMEHKD